MFGDKLSESEAEASLPESICINWIAVDTHASQTKLELFSS